MTLTEIMESDANRYIGIVDLIELLSKKTGEDHNTVLKYLAKYSSTIDGKISVYWYDEVLDAYYDAYIFSDVFENYSELPTYETIKSENDFTNTHFLKDEIFNAHCIELLDLDLNLFTSNNQTYNKLTKRNTNVFTSNNCQQVSDKELSPRSQDAVARMLYGLLKHHDYDISAHKGKTNSLIVNVSKLSGKPVTEKFVSDWIKRLQDIDKELNQN